MDCTDYTFRIRAIQSFRLSQLFENLIEKLLELFNRRWFMPCDWPENPDFEPFHLEIRTDAFLPKDKYGGTALHAAAREGRVDDMKAILKNYPDAVTEVTAAGETCLHTAVAHNKRNAVRYLLNWLAKNRHYAYLINAKDYDGNTALHLAASRKQLKTFKAILTCDQSINEVVDVNARNSGGITALDLLYFLPYSGKIDMAIDQILRQAGALRAKDLVNLNICTNCYGGVSNGIIGEWHRPSLNSQNLLRLAHVLLLITTMLALITWPLPLGPYMLILVFLAISFLLELYGFARLRLGVRSCFSNGDA